MNRAARFWVSFCLILTGSLIFQHQALCQNAHLLEGIQQYRQENYEEAIEALTKARKEEPRSSTAAFFLGLSYKQAMDYPKAAEHLRDAVTFTPRIKEALVELVEVLYRLPGPEGLQEAKKWIQVAEQESVSPPNTAFLKGMVLQKEGKLADAVKAFEEAKSLNPDMAQSADLQIALCYMKDRDLKKAKERLQATILRDAETDLASFARQYLDMVQRTLEAQKPLRFWLSAFAQYDTNVVLKPTEGSLAPGVTDEESPVLNSLFRATYTPFLRGPWLFSANYALVSRVHGNNGSSHDSLSNVLSVSPGYNFGDKTLNLALNYSHALVKSPSYEAYVDSIGAGLLFRTLLNPTHILEVYAGSNWSDYRQPPLIPEEDRDSGGWEGYVSWIWLFKKDAFFNLRYGYGDTNTEGSNWDNQGYRLSLSTIVPLRERLRLQLSGEAYFQFYDNAHSVFGAERDDQTYQASSGVTWEFFKNTNLIVQYTKTRADSNIGIYDYERDLYSAGLEYRF